MQQKLEGMWGREREVSIVELSETEAKEAAGREQAKEDLDSPQETAHILRGGPTPTAAQKLYSIHTDTLVF